MMTAPATYNDDHPLSTPLDRQEALELLAAMRAGVEIMQPEPRHLQALIELQADGTEEEDDVYPNEHQVTPLDEQEAIERGRQARLRIIHAMSPEEKEYRARKVKPIPGWMYLPFGAGLALTVGAMLYVAFALGGIRGVIGLLVIALLLGLTYSLCVVAQDGPTR